MSNSAVKDFSKRTLAQLAKKGISILSACAVPAFEGDQYFSGTAYTLVYEGRSFIRTHYQTIVIASSSWDPAVDLD